MKVSQSPTPERDEENPSLVTFDSVVATLRKAGVINIRKYHFRVEETGPPPYLVGNKRFPLGEPELERPEFWVPVVFDGYHWVVRRCVPPWITDDEEVENWDRNWIVQGERGPAFELEDDPEDFVGGELSTCRWLARQRLVEIQEDSEAVTKKIDAMLLDSEEYLAAKIEGRLLSAKPVPWAADARTAEEYLKRAMIDAYAIDGTFPPRDEASVSEGETIPLSDPIARIIECAFKAGRLAEKVGTYFRGVPEIARKGKVLVDHQNGARGRNKAWLKRVEEILRSKDSISNLQISKILRDEEIVFTMDDWGHVEFEDKLEERKTWKGFVGAVGRVRKGLKEEGRDS